MDVDGSVWKLMEGFRSKLTFTMEVDRSFWK